MNPRQRIFVAGLCMLAVGMNMRVSAGAGDFESPGINGAVDRQLAPYGLPGWHGSPGADVKVEFPSLEERQKRKDAMLLLTMNRKLDTIVIPVVDFRDMALSDAVDWLKAATARFDGSETEPGVKGFNLMTRFQTQGDKAFNPKVSLHVTGGTARVVVQVLADRLGLKVEVGPHVVVLAKP